MRTTRLITILVTATVLHLTAALAQEKAKDTLAPPSSGFRAEFLKQLDDVEKKITDLAQAVPQEKFSWRPAEGVRSVS